MTPPLRSTRDLRPLHETTGPMYLRRAADGIEIRHGRTVRRIPTDRARELVSYEYDHVPNRGASYRRYGLLVCDTTGTPVAHLGGPLTPMWDTDEVARFAAEWDMGSRHIPLHDDEEFTAAFGRVGRVSVDPPGTTVLGLLTGIGMLVATLGGAALGLAGFVALAERLDIAGRPGVGGALFVCGVAVGGAGCLFLMFAALEVGRRALAALRPRLARDGALRPTPRRGPVRLAVEDDELVAYLPDGARRVLPWPAGTDRTVGTLRTYRVPSPIGTEHGLLVLDTAGRTVLVVRCAFAANQVARFGRRTGLAVADELTESPGAQQMRLDTLPAGVVIGWRRPVGLFTVTVGATVLGALAYTPVVVGVVLLLGLVVPARAMDVAGFVLAIVPAPLVGPVTYRQLRRWRAHRARPTDRAPVRQDL